MKFGKTLIKKNKVVDIDRRWPFFLAILLIVQQIKNVFKLLFSCPLDHGFYCGTLKLLDGN